VVMWYSGQVVQWSDSGQVVQWSDSGQVVQWSDSGHVVQWSGGTVVRQWSGGTVVMWYKLSENSQTPVITSSTRTLTLLQVEITQLQ